MVIATPAIASLLVPTAVASSLTPLAVASSLTPLAVASLLGPVVLASVLVLLAVALVVGLAVADERCSRALTRFARRHFGPYVGDAPDRRRLLQSAYVDRTYRSYAARTYLYAVLAGIAGGIVGGYLVAGFVALVPTLVALARGLPPTMVTMLGLWEFELVLTPGQWAVIVLAGVLVGGIGSSVLTYVLRWELPRGRAAGRRRKIDEALPRTVAFMYALARGGVAFPEVLRTLARNDDVFGESAREVRVAVDEMDLFGRDMITAVRRMAARSPSEEFKTFSENLASVLQSGRSLASFLEGQYERYHEEAVTRQREVVERLATIAEIYVTTLVAGVLFLITILLVFGLTTTDTLWLLQLLAYVMVPLANAGFVVYLGQRLDALGIESNRTSSMLDDREARSPIRPDPPASSARADGEGPPAHADGPPVHADGAPMHADGPVHTDGQPRTGPGSNDPRRQLRIHDRVERLRDVVGSPRESLLWRPTRILYLTVPLALLYVAARTPAAFATDAFNVRLLDDVLVQALLFVLGTFAVLRTLYARRVRRIERATPELLERLASLNEAGMSPADALARLRGSDVGALTEEVERLHADVATGANFEDALVRLGRRVRTASVGRVVTLLTNAMRASGSLGPILRIAARQARADLRLGRRRRQTMFTYLAVIYVSFLVFLVIIVVVKEGLVPNLPSDVAAPNAGRSLVGVDQFVRFGNVDKAAFTLVFFHTALIQAICSGFVGGMFGEGTLRDGAKHAAVMLGLAYVVFLLVSAPVAGLTTTAVDPGDETVRVESVSLSTGGFVAFHEGDPDGPVVGSSEYLEAGTHRNVWVSMDSSPDDDDTLVAVVHLDTDGDRRFTPDAGPLDRPYPASGEEEFVSATVEVG